MAQHWYSTKVCDGCGKIVHSKDGQRDTTRWLHLSEFGEDFLKDGDLDYVDWDFCTNECLRKWANEQKEEKNGTKMQA